MLNIPAYDSIILMMSSLRGELLTTGAATVSALYFDMAAMCVAQLGVPEAPQVKLFDQAATAEHNHVGLSILDSYAGLIENHPTRGAIVLGAVSIVTGIVAATRMVKAKRATASGHYETN